MIKNLDACAARMKPGAKEDLNGSSRDRRLKRKKGRNVKTSNVKLLALLLLSATAWSQNQNSPAKIPAGVEPGILIKRVQPIYPPAARAAGIEGVVILQAQISKEGDIANLQLISGHPMLADAAVEAVKQWKYEPYRKNDEPVVVDTQIQVNFSLKNGVTDSAPPVPQGAMGGVIGSVLSSTPPPGANTGAPMRVRVASGVVQGLLISRVPPVYPPVARQARIQGVVTLQAQIDKEGNVKQLDLISGHPLLVQAAMDAVKQWKYKPFLLNGKPCEVDTQIQVNFSLAPSNTQDGSQGKS
jgi:TonB family protein